MTTQFDGLATTYADARPDYPDAAMQFVLAGLACAEPIRVLDVGYGTGIAANALMRAAAAMNPPRALLVEGVEPGADMRAVAATRGPRVAALHATSAEATGVPTGSFDLVLCAQAFHWFDAAAAVAEFHRVLRARGRAALVWNLRQEGVDPLTDVYNRVVSTTARLDPLQAERRAELAKPLTASALFSDFRQAEFPNPQIVSEEGLLARATSASYFPRTEPERGSALAELRRAFRSFAPSGQGALLHTCQVTLATAA